MFSLFSLFLICQRYKNESNSQHVIDGMVNTMHCFWYVKDIKMKAIHNAVPSMVFNCPLFLICQRYKNESNSQHIFKHNLYLLTVSDMSKI